MAPHGKTLCVYQAFNLKIYITCIMYNIWYAWGKMEHYIIFLEVAPALGFPGPLCPTPLYMMYDMQQIHP